MNEEASAGEGVHKAPKRASAKGRRIRRIAEIFSSQAAAIYERETAF